MLSVLACTRAAVKSGGVPGGADGEASRRREIEARLKKREDRSHPLHALHALLVLHAYGKPRAKETEEHMGEALRINLSEQAPALQRFALNHLPLPQRDLGCPLRSHLSDLFHEEHRRPYLLIV